MVVSWPAKIKHDEKPRDCFLHLVDVLPTILEAAHLPMPKTVNGIEQKPLAGKSFLASFDDPGFKGRDQQYFEILSNRSIYSDGWKANAQHTLPWRQDLAPGNWDKDKWELYYLPDDFSEAVDLAAKDPEKLAEMKKKFDAAAEEFHVLPLDDRGAARLAVPKPLPPGAEPGTTNFTYFAGAVRIAEPAAPPMKNQSWTLTADLKTEGAKTEGVIVGFGGVAAGLVLYLDKGVPVFDYNYFEKHTVVKGDKPLPADEATVTVDFAYQGGQGEVGKGADITLSVNGDKVAEGKMEATVPGRFGVDTFGIGEDSGQPVTRAYKAPFKFTGEIEKVVVDIK
jgi:arylsulfatase